VKVILTKTIEKVGIQGDVVNVKRGYARNYLIPKTFAIIATPQNMKKADELKQSFAADEQRQYEVLKKQGEAITALQLTFFRKVDESDNMYGSVSESDILHMLQEKGIDIPKTAIHMEKHLKQLGEFEIPIRLHKDVVVQLRGIIEKEPE